MPVRYHGPARPSCHGGGLPLIVHDCKKGEPAADHALWIIGVLCVVPLVFLAQGFSTACAAPKDAAPATKLADPYMSKYMPALAEGVSAAVSRYKASQRHDRRASLKGL